MTKLLIDTLCSEIDSFDKSGDQCVENLLLDSNSFLNELKLVETALEAEVETNDNRMSSKKIDKLDKHLNTWYKKSITSLKSYNSSTNKLFKNVLNNPKFNIDLDDAYTYPLNLYNYPVKSNQTKGDDALNKINANNRTELIKAIIIHLLKVGQGGTVVKELLKEIDDSNTVVDETALDKFAILNRIIDDITVRHDLTSALRWLEDKYNENVMAMSTDISLDSPSPCNYSQIEFKFHMLQLIILLNTSGHFTIDDSLSAYLYSKEKFTKFFNEYLNEISPLMTLLLYKGNSEHEMKMVIKDLVIKIKQGFELDMNKNHVKKNEGKFIAELLDSFEDIHGNQTIFMNLANEFISEYCKDMHLSKESSLFQSVLAGYVYLTSFYKYNQIQEKLNKIKGTKDNDDNLETIINYEATYHYDLPFQLPDASRFLFRYHPIFICPVSKEQLIPITSSTKASQQNGEQRTKRTKTLSDVQANPVVVLNFCQHLALRESVWQLSKKGNEIFKCHYCYKKHKFSDVTEAYIIDY